MHMPDDNRLHRQVIHFAGLAARQQIHPARCTFLAASAIWFANSTSLTHASEIRGHMPWSKLARGLDHHLDPSSSCS